MFSIIFMVMKYICSKEADLELPVRFRVRIVGKDFEYFLRILRINNIERKNYPIILKVLLMAVLGF